MVIEVCSKDILNYLTGRKGSGGGVGTRAQGKVQVQSEVPGTYLLQGPNCSISP